VKEHKAHQINFSSSKMSYLIVAIALLLGSYVLSQLLFKVEQPKIKGLPEIPGWPIVGNLLQLGSDHASVCKKWAEKYGPVFQVR
jgi:phenylacetate 2-hydroxylase